MFDKCVDNLINLVEIRSKESLDTGDFVKNGLLHCWRCGTPKQCRVEMLSVMKIFSCLCICESKKAEQRRENERQMEENRHISRMRVEGIRDKELRKWTFAYDDGGNPDISDKTIKYCEKWKRMYEKNIGLLFWGNVGTGKTFFAACIANTLIDNGIPVMMTSFPKIINALSGYDEKDKNEYLNSLNKYKLLVIDDLGAEHQSDYSLSIVYNVIDSRYENGQPLILTTNLTLDEMRYPDKTKNDITYSRIYSRILEMCVPIQCNGENRRDKAFIDKVNELKMIFDD